MTNKLIYLDAHATTPVDPEVLQAMLPYFTEYYGNGNHKFGWKAKAAMEQARIQVASLLGARPTEILFTSGATESINLALVGLAKAHQGKRNHIVTQQTEHSAVLKTIEALRERGFRVTMLELDSVGRIDLQELEEVVTEETLLVAIMLVNNEIGTIQPAQEIGAICRRVGARFFCDITQGLGWYPIDLRELNIDLAAMSSHKINGPRGVGALFVRRFRPKVQILPISYGGSQERCLRPGTANIPGIVGFGKACEIKGLERAKTAANIQAMRDRLQDILFAGIEGIQLNGCPKHRHPGNLNLSIPNVSGEDLIGALPHIIFSTGSACTSGSAKPSYVVSAIRQETWRAKNAFRFGISQINSMEEIIAVGQQMAKVARKLQDKRNLKKLEKIRR